MSKYVCDGGSTTVVSMLPGKDPVGVENYELFHEEDGLSREVRNGLDEVICSCNGTILAVNQCLAVTKQLMAESTQSSDVRLPIQIAQHCARRGLVQLATKLRSKK